MIPKDKPVRVQLSRAKGFRLQEASLAVNGLPAVKVDRTTSWGNDFTVEDFGSAEQAVEMFTHDVDKFQVFHPDKYEAWIAPLRGQNLACWCRLCPAHKAGKPFGVECPDCAPCHSDPLGLLANPTLPQGEP